MKRILLLSDGRPLGGEQLGYYQALGRCAEVMICEFAQLDRGEPDGDLLALLKESSFKPHLLVHVAASGFLAPSITRIPVPTAYFHIDTYFGTHQRIRLAMFFDYAFVFHPGYEERFRQAGHPRSILTPHAVDADLFKGRGCNRIFDVGWVGSMKPHLYTVRHRIIPQLDARFQMNDWERSHTVAEMAQVYKQSKIVVNVGRDDYPQDANLRTFEAMAGGALLITSLPTELTALGFAEGKHFVGYRNERDVPALVEYYVGHEGERDVIAEAGRRKVLSEHTYERRVRTVLDAIGEDKGRLFAPARRWKESRVRYEYLYYYADQLFLRCAWEELWRLWAVDRPHFTKAFPLLVRATLRTMRRKMRGPIGRDW